MGSGRDGAQGTALLAALRGLLHSLLILTSRPARWGAAPGGLPCVALAARDAAALGRATQADPANEEGDGCRQWLPK